MLLTTLERYKSKYEITDNALDDQITMEIEQVSAEIETTCNRIFAETDYEIVMYGSGTNELLLNEYPIKTATVADYTEFVINKKAGILQSGSVWSPTVKYTINFTAGYATIPADIEKACMIMVSMGLERRGSEHLKTEVVGPLRSDFATNFPDILEKYRKIPV